MMQIQPKIEQINSKQFLLLNDFIEADMLPAGDMGDVWLVNSTQGSKVKKFLRQVLRSNDRRVYLKPILLEDRIRPFLGVDAAIIGRLSDGYFEAMSPLKLATLIDQVHYYLNRFLNPVLPGMDQHERVLQYIFDLAYTRGSAIIPLRSHQSLTGYAYPRIDSFFFNIKDAYMNSRLILKKAAEEGFLVRTYHDTQHLCSDCNSGFLNYHEICPKCKNHNLKAMPLVHHFRCAYVGPESDFMLHDNMVCPKCSTALRNLGVDYDKPGKVFICKNQQCNHKFQEAPIRVCCVDCGKEHDPYELVVKKVYEYALAERGIQRYVYGAHGIKTEVNS